MITNDKLALFGGTPIRKKNSFQTKPFVGEEDLKLINEIFESKILSGFSGSDIGESEEILKSKSIDLNNLESYQSATGGKWVRKFESICAKKINADYCISVNSATSAIHAAILALDIEPGSEIITTPYTFTACVAAILQANCIPVFADIDPDTFCLSIKSIKEVFSKNTKAILHVSWCGNSGEIDIIEKYCLEKNIYLIDDSSQSQFSKLNNRTLGTFGDIGIYSFNQSKNVSVGEGGMIITNNKRLAFRSRLIRNHAENFICENYQLKDMVNMAGFNFRLNEIAAAIGYNQILNSEFLNNTRLNNYNYLIKKLIQFEDFIIPQKISNKESFYSYLASFRFNYKLAGISRDTFIKALQAEGIPASIGVQRLLSDHPNIKKRIAWGKKNIPWSLKPWKFKINSSKKNKLDNSHDLFYKSFFGFYQLGWPTNFKDIDEIILAFEKIFRNIDKLRL